MSRPSIRILIAALVAIAASPAIAQDPALAASTVRLTGSVYDSTGQPLRDIAVTLMRTVDGDDDHDVATRRTTDTGRFTFPPVPRGTDTKYYLAATDFTGHHAPIYTSPTFTAGSTDAPNLQMKAAGFIAGKVSTKDGNHVSAGAGIAVTAEGKISAQRVSVAANGTFRIGSLLPGQYELTFDDPDLAFASGCYDNVPTSAQICKGSQKVTVRADKVATIRPQVLDNPYEQVSGTVTDASGKPLEGIFINGVQADNGKRFLGSTYTGADGRWTIRGIDHVGPIKVRADDESGDTKVTVWYRNATTFTTAKRVTLTDGSKVSGIGIVFPAA